MTSVQRIHAVYLPPSETRKDDPPKGQTDNLGKFSGLCFSPFRAGQDPTRGIFPTVAQIEEDLLLIRDNNTPPGETLRIRTFGVDNTLNHIPRLCNEHGVNCYPGAWIASDTVANRQNLNLLIAIGQQNYPTTKGLIVGNEVMYSRTLPESTLIKYFNQVKAAVPSLPVGYAETWYEWSIHPNIANAVDQILVNIYPYWEGIHVDSAAAYTLNRWQYIKGLYPTKQVFIGEAGWPTAGDDVGQAHPSEENQIQFVEEFRPLAQQNNAPYFYFSAFDEAWKRQFEGEVGAHWGIYYEDRTPKPSIVGIYESKEPIPVVQNSLNNYPNPVRTYTDIRYSLPVAQKISLKIYNSNGQLVRTLVNEDKPAGNYSIKWDGKDGSGIETAPGVYLCTLELNGEKVTNRIIKIN